MSSEQREQWRQERDARRARRGEAVPARREGGAEADEEGDNYGGTAPSQSEQRSAGADSEPERVGRGRRSAAAGSVPEQIVEDQGAEQDDVPEQRRSRPPRNPNAFVYTHGLPPGIVLNEHAHNELNPDRLLVSSEEEGDADSMVAERDGQPGDPPRGRDAGPGGGPPGGAPEMRYKTFQPFVGPSARLDKDGGTGAAVSSKPRGPSRLTHVARTLNEADRAQNPVAGSNEEGSDEEERSDEEGSNINEDEARP